MKAKPLFLVIAALLAAGGLWLAQWAWRTHAPHESSIGADSKPPHGPDFSSNSAAALLGTSQTGSPPGPNTPSKPGQMVNPVVRLAPPVPNRRFTDFTPEQRVQFARQGHGPGG